MDRGSLFYRSVSTHQFFATGKRGILAGDGRPGILWGGCADRPGISLDHASGEHLWCGTWIIGWHASSWTCAEPDRRGGGFWNYVADLPSWGY